jgi:L-fucose isomerase-like protein
MIKALQKAGMDVVVLGPDQTKYGAVETYEEAKSCAELFKSKRTQSTAVLPCRILETSVRLRTPPTFAFGRAGAGASYAGYSGKMAITHRRDSFCGKMSACNNCANMAFRIL